MSYEVWYFQSAYPYEYFGCCGHEHASSAEATTCERDNRHYWCNKTARIEPPPTAAPRPPTRQPNP